MRWLLRIALCCIFLGLLALAILPYLPTLQREGSALISTWKQVRSGEPIAPTKVLEEIPAVKSNQRRSVVVPTDLIEKPELDDPLLEEARRRAEQNPESAMAWLQSQPNGPLRLRGMLEVVAHWVAEDSENALLWLESNAQGIARLETLKSGVELWAQQDPQAAASWIDGMANDGSKITAAKALASNWVQNDPDGAVAWLSELPSGSLRNEVTEALVESWSVSDPELATIWALGEAEFEGNSYLLHQSIQNYAQISPDGAEAFLRELTEAYDASEAIETYLRARSETDPAQTMDWQSQLSADDPLNQTENARIIMQEWSRTDSVAASSWLSNQSADSERDAAILGFGDTMLAYEPEAATAWANYISDPETRATQLFESVQTWAKHQPHEALEWVKTAELDPDLRTALASEIGAD
ncbi:MAG: hypothetical protein ACSHYA_03000 [Opitutaceae bacterium]